MAIAAPGARKILVPVDFSPSSRLALDWALSIAEKTGGTVHVLHTWEIPVYLRPDLTVWSGEISETLSEHTRAGAERGMREFLAAAGVEGRREVTTQVVAGAPYQTILAAASEQGFDLIAMGTHGRTGVAHLLMGSVAEKVVRHAPCPVLTIRAP